MHTLTLSFATLTELQEAVSKLVGSPRIAHEDRPDVGAEPEKPLALIQPPAAPAPSPLPPPVGFNPFAGGAAAPLPPPVLSTAGAAALPTAPEAPNAGLPTPPAAASLPAPPPAAAAPAPSAPAAPPSPAVAGTVERDKAGLPWDHRIHAKTKTKNADGTWRKLRGVDDAVVVAVEEELRRVAALTAPPAAAPAAALPPAPLTGTALPPAPPALDLSTFPAIAQALAPHLASGKMTNLTVTTTLGEFGMANLFQLATASPEVQRAVGEKFRPMVLAAAAA